MIMDSLTSVLMIHGLVLYIMAYRNPLDHSMNWIIFSMYSLLILIIAYVFKMAYRCAIMSEEESDYVLETTKLGFAILAIVVFWNLQGYSWAT